MKWPWKKTKKWNPEKHPVAVREFGEDRARRLWEAGLLGSNIVRSTEGRRSTLTAAHNLQAMIDLLDPNRAEREAREKYLNEDDVPL